MMCFGQRARYIAALGSKYKVLVAAYSGWDMVVLNEQAAYCRDLHTNQYHFEVSDTIAILGIRNHNILND